MQLIGTPVSPYVRRFRLLLANTDFEFEALNIYEGEDRQTLMQQNPANRVPVLVDDNQTIVESRVIYRYLQQKLGLVELDWPQENNLSLVDAATESLVIMIMLRRSGIDIEQDLLVLNLQKDRMNNILPALEREALEGDFDEWNYVSISLYTLLDWMKFRNLWDISEYPNLLKFMELNANQPMIAETAPKD